MDEKEKAVMDAGVQYGMQMLQQMPQGNKLEMESHITGVLIVFWGALCVLRGFFLPARSYAQRGK